MVDALDSKSSDSNVMRVQVPRAAPIIKQITYILSDFLFTLKTIYVRICLLREGIDMTINQNVEKLELHQKKIDIIKAALEKAKIKSNRPFGQPQAIYDGELHSLMIKEIMAIHDDLKYLDSSDIEIVSRYSNLLNNLLVTQNIYLDNCFSVKQFQLNDQRDEKWLEFLINEFKYLTDIRKTASSSQEKKVTEQRKKSLSKYLDEHKKKFLNKCKTFNVGDEKMISGMLTIINAFENSDYDLFNYLAVSDAYDAHGKSDCVDFYVFHPKKVSYREDNYSSPDDLKSVLNSSKRDYIIREEYSLNHFKNLSYLNVFLEEIANWRYKHYLLNLNRLKNNSYPVTFPIPDEVLKNIVNKVIQSTEQKNKQLALK